MDDSSKTPPATKTKSIVNIPYLDLARKISLRTNRPEAQIVSLFQEKAADNLPFIEAVSQATITEISTQFDEQAIAALKKQIESTGLFLVGEMHGVLENPAIFYTLMKKLNLRGLALEWEETMSTRLEQFLQNGNVELDRFSAESDDGRVTAGHFALIKRLKEESMLDKLIVFDPISAPLAGARDQDMADNILAYRDRTIPTLVAAGSFHTNTHEVLDTEDGMKAQHPMGEHIKRMYPDVPSAKIRYLKGNYYNSGSRTFDTSDDGSTSARFYQEADGSYVFVLPEAHEAVVPVLEPTV